MIELAEGEQHLCVVRKHWFILLRDTSVAVVLLVLPFIILPFIFAIKIPLGADATLSFSGVGTALVVFVSALWIFVMWMKIFGIWTDYYLDEWHITNRRVVDIDQVGFFRREIVTFGVEKIQDVKVMYPGIVSNLLNFGTVQVQTAGASDTEQFLIRGVAKPESIRQLILRCYDIHQDKFMRNSSDGL